MNSIEVISPDRMFLHALKLRQTELSEALKEAKKRLMTAPRGTLRIKQGKYFMTNDGKKLHYIRKKDFALIKALAQKAYDRVLVARISTELKLIEKLIDLNEKHPVNALFTHQKQERQKYILPVTLDNAVYAEKWKAVRFKHKGFMKGDPVIKTPSGIRMRSKSELLIASLLDEAGIAFRYEYPLEIKVNGKPKTYHPDFYCLDPETRLEFVWEHFGMMDDPVYRYHAEQKIMNYLFSGVFNEKNLITTYEEKDYPINPEEMRKNLACFLIKLRQ